MPVLAGVAVVGGGGGAAATGGSVLVIGGTAITATQLVIGAVVIGGITIAGITIANNLDEISDFIDDVLTDEEVERVLAQAGRRSKDLARTCRETQGCIWSQVNIQAQGTLIPAADGGATQGIGPYAVRGRGVTVSEGQIVLSATHGFAEQQAGRRNFKQIKRWQIFQETARFIAARPPAGLPPTGNDIRPGSLNRYAREARYDIVVLGNVNAFMV